jgi:hypothetical protein
MRFKCQLCGLKSASAVLQEQHQHQQQQQQVAYTTFLRAVLQCCINVCGNDATSSTTLLLASLVRFKACDILLCLTLTFNLV